MPVLRMIRRELYAQARSRGLNMLDAYNDANYGDGSQTDEQKIKAAKAIEASNKNVRERIDELLELTRESRDEREEKRKDLVAFDDAMGKVEILQGLRTVFQLAIRQPEVTIPIPTGEYDEDDEPIMEMQTRKGAADNLGAANRALELMGKQEGMFADTKIIKNDTDGMGTTELRAAIDKIDEQLAQIRGTGEMAKQIDVIEVEAAE